MGAIRIENISFLGTLLMGEKQRTEKKEDVCVNKPKHYVPHPAQVFSTKDSD